MGQGSLSRTAASFAVAVVAMAGPRNRPVEVYVDLNFGKCLVRSHIVFVASGYRCQ